MPRSSFSLYINWLYFRNILQNDPPMLSGFVIDVLPSFDEQGIFYCTEKRVYRCRSPPFLFIQEYLHE